MKRTAFDAFCAEYELTRRVRTLPPNLRDAITSWFEHLFTLAEEAYDYTPTSAGERVQNSRGGVRTIKDSTAFWLLRSHYPRELDAMTDKAREHLGLDHDERTGEREQFRSRVRHDGSAP